MTRDAIRKILKLTLFVVIISTIVGYIYFAFRDYISGPEIIVNEPINGSTITTAVTNVKGKVSRIKDISINNRPILIDEEGNFSEPLLLFPGYNIATLTATDKFGRVIEYKIELVYED